MKQLDFKSILRVLAILFALPLAFTACSDDDDEPAEPALAEQGLFVFNSGNQGKSIDGSLSFIDEKNETVLNGVFMTVNGRSLGSTVQDGVILGKNLYIAVSESNTIEVVNKNTLESVAQIKPASSEGSSPRDVVTDGEYVYVSMYSGHVSRINPATNTIDKTVAVGPNPEEMAITNGFLYVVNSDGLNWSNGYANGKSVSKIDLSTMTEKKMIDVGINPTKIGADASGNVLLLCMGDYGANPASIWKINSSDVATDMGISATMMTVSGNTLYTINSPWGATEVTYKAYSTTTGSVTKQSFVNTPVDSPAGIAVHPTDGRIFITSYNLVDGYASYSTPGYVAEYETNGDLVKKYDVGVGAVYMTFLK
ncbi:MAG: YncE family protein [Bacteroides sp.]|nr:YncE family protein [Bacteroides sp.]